MLTLKEAIKIVEEHLPHGQTLRQNYGEAQGKYLFKGQFADGTIPPGGFYWTVDKESGECKCLVPERIGNKPFSPIRDYKKLYLEES